MLPSSGAWSTAKLEYSTISLYLYRLLFQHKQRSSWLTCCQKLVSRQLKQPVLYHPNGFPRYSTYRSLDFFITSNRTASYFLHPFIPERPLITCVTMTSLRLVTLCMVKRYFKPYQNEHHSVKDQPKKMAKNDVTWTQKCPWKFCSTTHIPLLSSNLRACVLISDKKNWHTIYVILQHVHQTKSVRVCWKILAIWGCIFIFQIQDAFNLIDGWPQTSHDRNKQDSRHFIPSSYSKPQRFWSSSMLHFILFFLNPWLYCTI